MNTTRVLLVLAVFISAFVASRAAPAVKPDSRVKVEFADAESFTDLRDNQSGSSDAMRDSVMGELRSFLEKRGDSQLRDGLQLEIRVTDIDLAGEFEPWRGLRFDEVRIVRDIYPARIELEFRLTDSTGKVLVAGKRNLNDFGTLDFPGFAFNSDTLRHEKNLLGDWLRDEFRAYRRA